MGAELQRSGSVGVDLQAEASIDDGRSPDRRPWRGGVAAGEEACRQGRARAAGWGAELQRSEALMCRRKLQSANGQSAGGGHGGME